MQIKSCIPVISEFFVTDDDGYSHCFGVATDANRK
jgi:hypothetical protein